MERWQWIAHKSITIIAIILTAVLIWTTVEVVGLNKRKKELIDERKELNVKYRQNIDQLEEITSGYQELFQEIQDHLGHPDLKDVLK